MASFTKRGKAWQAKVRRKGYPEQIETFQSKADAQRWAREIESRIDRGAFIQTAEADRVTLGEALERYGREITSGKKSAARERNRIKRLKARPLALRTLARIRSADVAEYRDELKASGLGANSVRLELALLSHLFNTARKEWGYEGLRNPVEDVSRPSTAGTERTRRLDPGELEKLLEAAKAFPYWAGPMIELAIETAMRRGELAGLHRSHIDTRRRTAHLAKTKSGDARTVPLSPRALEILEAMPARIDGRIWPVTADAMTKTFEEIAKAAGSKDLRLHDMRHEATSRLFEAGLSIVEVAAITGHKTLAMLKRYTHPRPEDIAAKLAKKNPARGGG